MPPFSSDSKAVLSKLSLRTIDELEKDFARVRSVASVLGGFPLGVVLPLAIAASRLVPVVTRRSEPALLTDGLSCLGGGDIACVARRTLGGENILKENNIAHGVLE